MEGKLLKSASMARYLGFRDLYGKHGDCMSAGGQREREIRFAVRGDILRLTIHFLAHDECMIRYCDSASI